MSNMNNPLISIVMPAYNVKTVIREAIQSVIEQTYSNWELLIVDDHSTDGTDTVTDSYANEKIHILHNSSNCGAAESRNYAIKYAGGDWIAFLDADDMWAKDKLEKQVKLIMKCKGALLTYTGSSFMNDSGEKLKYIMQVPEKINFATLLKQNLISCSSVMVKKDLVINYPFPSQRLIHEDYAVWLKILQEVSYAYGINEPLLIYRLSKHGRSHNKLIAAKMNWNTYGFINLSLGKKIAAMFSYTVRGVQKYSKLK